MVEMLFEIPEQKYEYFMAQLEKLGFLTYLADRVEIPTADQQQVLKLHSEAKESDFQDWDDIKNTFGLDD